MPVPPGPHEIGWDSYPIETNCWHQEKGGIPGKSKQIDVHSKAKPCLINDLINKQIRDDGFCARSPGLGIAMAN